MPQAEREIEQAQQFIGAIVKLTPKQQAVLLQAMEDVAAGSCTIEDAKARMDEVWS